MAQVDTATPSVDSRDQTVADEAGRAADLGAVEGWSFKATFAYPSPQLGFTYDSSGPTLDISSGRVARRTDSGQQILSVSAVAGLSLASDAVNYVYFRADDSIEIRDQDEPPSPAALLIGTVDTADGVVDTDVRGRNPVSPFVQAADDTDTTATGTSDALGRAVIVAGDMADGETRLFREFIADDRELTVEVAGVMNDTGSTVSGLTAEVVDEGSGVLHSTTAKRDVGLLVEESALGDVVFRVANNSGGTVNGVSGRWEYSISAAREVGPIDDFEDGDLSEYDVQLSSGATASTASPVKEGSYSLKSTDGFARAHSSPSGGLDNYPARGDTFRGWMLNEGSAAVEFYWASDNSRDNHYGLSLNPPSNEFEIFKNSGGSFTPLASTSATLSNSTWYEVEVDYGQSTIQAKLRDASGSELASISASDSEHGSGGIFFDMFNTGDAFDYFRIV